MKPSAKPPVLWVLLVVVLVVEMPSEGLQRFADRQSLFAGKTIAAVRQARLPKTPFRNMKTTKTKADQATTSSVTKPVAKTPVRGNRTKTAYEMWMKEPFLNITQASAKFKISQEGLRGYIIANKLPRPDGKAHPSDSDRQKWIIKGYEQGVKNKWDVSTAAKWVREKTGLSCQTGDIQYYANKNNLPLLNQPNVRGLPPLPPIPTIL